MVGEGRKTRVKFPLTFSIRPHGPPSSKGSHVIIVVVMVHIIIIRIALIPVAAAFVITAIIVVAVLMKVVMLRDRIHVLRRPVTE